MRTSGYRSRRVGGVVPETILCSPVPRFSGWAGIDRGASDSAISWGMEIVSSHVRQWLMPPFAPVIPIQPRIHPQPAGRWRSLNVRTLAKATPPGQSRPETQSVHAEM